MTTAVTDAQHADEDAAAADQPTAVPEYWWTRPASLIGRLRPGLREATLADSYRLRQLPALVGTVLVPLLAIGVPLAVAILHAGTPPNGQPIPDPMSLTIHDVFSESLPLMAAALAIGIASPAAGALLVLVFGLGNLAVTAVTGELEPPLDATFGRLVSYGLLWLLAVEIPMWGRSTVESTVGDERAPGVRRWAAVGLGTVVIAVATFAWAQAVPMLITVVYWTTAAWGNPFLAAVEPLQQNSEILVAVAFAAGAPLLSVRYLGPWVVFSPPALPTIISRLPLGSMVSYVLSAAVALALLSGVISQPIDAGLLVAALLGARPLGRIALKGTRLAAPLAQIAAPVRLMLGFGAAVVANWMLLSLFGSGDWSRFSTAVLAIAAGIVVISFLTAADDVAQETSAALRARSVVSGTIGGLTALGAIVVAFPPAVLADNCGDLADCWTDLLKAALACAGAAVLAAQWDANRILNAIPGMPPTYPTGGPFGPPTHKPPPPPPPWYGGGYGAKGGGMKR